MDLAVQERQKLGKQTSALRKQGFIPAELYGHGVGNVHLSVNRKAFEKAFKTAGESTVINLTFGNEKRSALVHDIQKDSVTDEIVHIDFYQVRMNEKITAKVALEFIGEPPAVKTLGGVLNKTLSEIEVEALPGDLPRHIEVDLSGLQELNQSIYVKDLRVSDKVKIMLDPETVIATITSPVEEEKIEKAPVADVSEVKVEAEEKAAERAKEKEKVPEAETEK